MEGQFEIGDRVRCVQIVHDENTTEAHERFIGHVGTVVERQSATDDFPYPIRVGYWDAMMPYDVVDLRAEEVEKL